MPFKVLVFNLAADDDEIITEVVLLAKEAEVEVLLVAEVEVLLVAEVEGRAAPMTRCMMVTAMTNNGN